MAMSSSNREFSSVVARLNLLEEQCQRHEAEISTFLDQIRAPAFSALETRLSQLEAKLQSEELYRQGAELVFGERSFERNPTLGLSRLKASAVLGHTEASLCYGILCDEGKICPRNAHDAAEFIGNAAQDGNAFAQANYCRLLRDGFGVAKNEAEAVRFSRLSADQGSAAGQCALGNCLRLGVGVAQNIEEAAKYYKLSADQGYGSAQFNYGAYLEIGNQNVPEAVRYYRMAADQGVRSAQRSYGQHLRDGIGTPKNVEEGERYLAMARAK
jgi:TPR repeat protein